LLTALLQVAEPSTRVIVERTLLEQIALVGQALTSLVVLGLLVAATLTMLALRKGLDELTRLVRNTSSDITAAVHDAREVADELRAMTSRVRGSVETVTRGVESVSRGVATASDAAGVIRKQRRRRRRGPRGDGASDRSPEPRDDEDPDRGRAPREPQSEAE
jgi:uncharacterized protein YoxC